jgi:hypothetical protein
VTILEAIQGCYDLKEGAYLGRTPLLAMSQA